MGSKKQKRRQLAAMMKVGQFLVELNERINGIAEAGIEIAGVVERRDAELLRRLNGDKDVIWKNLDEQERRMVKADDLMDKRISELHSLFMEHSRDWQECEKRISLYVEGQVKELNTQAKVLAADCNETLHSRDNRLDRVEKLLASDAEVLKLHGERITRLQSKSAEITNAVNKAYTEVRQFDNRIRGCETALRLPRPNLEVSNTPGDEIVGGNLIMRDGKNEPV